MTTLNQNTNALRHIRRQQVLTQAEGYLELGMFQHAIDGLTQWDSPSRLDAQASLLLGEALRSLERHEEAIAPLLRAVDSIPEDLSIHLALAWCFKRTGRLDRAIETLEQALLISPTEAILYYNLACYWSLASNRELTLKYLSQALDFDTSYRELIDGEPDFDTIRDDQDFRSLISVIV